MKLAGEHDSSTFCILRGRGVVCPVWPSGGGAGSRILPKSQVHPHCSMLLRNFDSRKRIIITETKIYAMAEPTQLMSNEVLLTAY